MLRGEYKIGLIIGDDVGLMIGGVLGLIIGGVLALLIIGGVIGLLCGDGVEVGVKTGSYSSAKNCLTNLSLSTSSTEVWLARKSPTNTHLQQPLEAPHHLQANLHRELRCCWVG